MGSLDEWVILVIDGRGGAVRRNIMLHHVNIKLFASHAFWEKCALTILDMSILHLALLVNVLTQHDLRA